MTPTGPNRPPTVPLIYTPKSNLKSLADFFIGQVLRTPNKKCDSGCLCSHYFSTKSFGHSGTLQSQERLQTESLLRSHACVLKKATKCVAACEVWFSRLYLMNVNWQRRSAMSYVIRWVAMLFCSQRGSIIRSLIMERVCGRVSKSSFQKTKQEKLKEHQQERVAAASRPGQTLLFSLSVVVSLPRRSINQLLFIQAKKPFV